MNPNTLTIIISIAATLILSFIGAQILTKVQNKADKEKMDLMLQESREKAKTIELEARDEALRIKQQSEGDITRRRNELAREDDRLQKRRDDLDNRFERLEQREQAVNKRQSSVDKRFNEVETLYSEQMEKLQEISHMTSDEARQILGLKGLDKVNY